jgi:tRNA(Ile)-lysidine synthase
MRRAAARAFLTAIGQPWREDATNADVRHARNFVRHEILARCEEGAYPACIESIVRLGGQAAVQAAALASAADRLLEEHGRHERQGVIALDASRLAGLDPHLVAEVFVALWRREGWPQRAMSAAHYASLARLTAGVGTTAVLPGAVHVETDGRTMRLERRF